MVANSNLVVPLQRGIIYRAKMRVMNSNSKLHIYVRSNLDHDSYDFDGLL
jgi:hypothetical protein